MGRGYNILPLAAERFICLVERNRAPMRKQKQVKPFKKKTPKKLGKLSKRKKKIVYGFALTSRFLYVVGIQSIRIRKRFHRKLKRFFSPLARLFCRLYAAVLGKRIVSLHKEFKSMKTGWASARDRFRAARQKGIFSAAAEVFRIFGKSLVSHRRIVLSLLNVAVPFASIFLLAATFRYWSGLNYGLVLVNSGQRIATICDESTYEKATEMVNQRMVHDLAEDDASVRFAPQFTLTVSNDKSFASISSVCDSLILQSNGIIEEASGLYVDGEIFGVVKSSADLRFILQDALDAAKGGDENATTHFEKNVETVNGLFPTTSIISSDEMRKKVNATSSEAVTYVVKEGDTVTSIAEENHITVSELNALNGNKLGDTIHPGDTISLKAAVPVLGIEVENTETYQVSLPFTTVTERDDTQYTDYSKVKTDGENGVQQCVDKVTTLNGVEIKRESVSRAVLKTPVSKVVAVGTKKRPANAGAGVSTGKLMWPVPSLHTITTYFTWRWGEFHYGIDISGSNAYGKTIVAADGGTVTQAGWNNGYGYYVLIQHGGGMATLYGHASKLLVKSGQLVAKGQAIALVGSTGNSTGSHCHFEVRKNGVKVNPLDYISNG